MAAVQQRARRIPPTVVDGTLAIVCAAMVITSAWVTANDEHHFHRVTPAAVVVLLLTTLPLTWRRRWPAPVGVVCGIATAVYGAAPWPDPVLELGGLVALYTIVTVCDRRIVAIALTTTLPVFLAVTALSRDSDGTDYYRGFVLVTVTITLGFLHRAWRAAEADRARRAVADERARIARELHDVVAHHVSMMVVQAEAAAATAGDAAVVAGFDGIASTGRQALTELRRLLGVLREAEAPGGTAPQPGVDDIAALVAAVREVGLDAVLRVEGSPRPVPAGVGLSAYRIVQEALTNAVRHASGARAEVVLHWTADRLSVEVVDDGRAAGRDLALPGAGHGLVGIRERVAVVGGELLAGARDGGGFEVRATLPLGS